MLPAVAAGAHNPDNGMAGAEMPADLLTIGSASFLAPPPQAAAATYGAEALARQILDALARCRRLGHRDPRVTLTRPTAVIEGVRDLLCQAGFDTRITPSRTGFTATLSVRG